MFLNGESGIAFVAVWYLRRERREQGRPVGERDALGHRFHDVLQNQVSGRCDGRFIGRCISEPPLQEVRPKVLRRDRVDRVVDGPLDHSHVDLRCRGCPASGPRKPGSWNPDDRTDRNDVPLHHRGCVSGCGWCGRSADDAESCQDCNERRREPNGPFTCHVCPSPSAHPCYGLPLSCSACSKSLSARNARSAGPSCTCLPMLTSSLHQTPSFEPVFPSEHGEEPPLEGGSARRPATKLLDLKSMP